jgi:hypothetical protein
MSNAASQSDNEEYDLQKETGRQPWHARKAHPCQAEHDPNDLR